MPVKKLIIACFLLLPGWVSAQQRERNRTKASRQERVDSLLRKISGARPDTSLAVAYGALSAIYADSVKDTINSKADFDLAVLYAKKQLDLSNKLSWNRGIAGAYSNLAHAYPYLKYPSQAIYWLEKAANASDNPAVKNDMALEMAKAYVVKQDFPKARGLYLSIIPYFKKNGLVAKWRDVYLQLSYLSITQVNFNDYLRFNQLALGSFSPSDTSALHLQTLKAVATAYLLTDDFPHSLETLQQMEHLIIKTNRQLAMIDVYTTISYIYKAVGNYKQALETDLKQLRLMQSQPDRQKYPLTLSLSTVANDYFLMKEYDTSLAYTEKALQAARAESGLQSTIYTTIANNYKAKKDYAKALAFTKTAMAELDDERKKNKIRMVNNQDYVPDLLGEIYMEAPDSVLINAGIPLANRYQMALDIFTKNSESLKSISRRTGLPENYLNLSRAYERLHDNGKALENYKAYVTAKDTVDRLYDRHTLLQKELDFSYSKREDSLRYRQLLSSNQLKSALELSNREKDIERLNYQKTQASLLAEQNMRKANEENLRVSQKEQALSQAALQLQKADLKARRTQSYMMAAGLVVLLLVSLLIARSYYQQRKSNRTISSTNQLLNERQEELAAQRDQLSHTLTELQQTQQQLIQSEKLASLGELTAGIAHEIQNPLNFVNNFSEVSQELVAELYEELDKGDKEGAKVIANDLRQNLEKIHRNGKRADGIVKGMLEHSRASTGRKEPVDLNKITDEYAKLAYHGIKAKDKSFHADLHTHLSAGLPMVNIISQDIGRVLLNLFNNAFYAVQQKQKTAGAGYKPVVEVHTSREGCYLQLIVRDNGTGIPDNIKDKIMQPFFTTKPTGEGTGLGLSLSYDIIVKGHGGNIAVNSIPGKGAEFIVQVPC